MRSPLALAAACLGLAGCTGGGHPPLSTAAATPTARPSTAAPGSFASNGVSFSYPPGWRQLRVRGSSASVGDRLWTVTVGIDGHDVVSVAAFRLDAPITEANIGSRTQAIGLQLESLFTQAGGSLQQGPTRRSMAGLPALGFVGTAKDPNGATVHSRLVLAFDASTEYFVNCQYDDASRGAIEHGCEQIVSTFRVSGDRAVGA